MGILIPEWEWGEELRQELGLGQNRGGHSSSTLQRVPSSGHQLLLPSAHHTNKPFPKILLSSLIFNQTIKHINDLVDIQSILQQHNTAAQKPAQPFPHPQSHHSLIILAARQHQAPLFSFFSSGRTEHFLLSPKTAPSLTPTAIPSLQGCLQPRWWRVKL